jgi:hypothetical protein
MVSWSSDAVKDAARAAAAIKLNISKIVATQTGFSLRRTKCGRFSIGQYSISRVILFRSPAGSSLAMIHLSDNYDRSAGKMFMLSIDNLIAPFLRRIF